MLLIFNFFIIFKWIENSLKYIFKLFNWLLKYTIFNIYKLKNKIILKLKINESDLNHPIYFLDNNYDHYKLKELNKSNTKLFINEKKYEFQKYFVPSKVGIYTIRLNFNNLMKDCSYIFIIVNQ